MDSPADHDAPIGEEGRRRRSIDERADLLGLLVEDDLVDQQGAVAVAHEVVDQRRQRVAHQHIVAPLDQVDRAHAARASLSAAIVSATRRAALTS